MHFEWILPHQNILFGKFHLVPKVFLWSWANNSWNDAGYSQRIAWQTEFENAKHCLQLHAYGEQAYGHRTISEFQMPNLGVNAELGLVPGPFCLVHTVNPLVCASHYTTFVFSHSQSTCMYQPWYNFCLFTLSIHLYVPAMIWLWSFHTQCFAVPHHFHHTCVNKHYFLCQTRITAK